MRIITYISKSVFICLFVFLLNINSQATALPTTGSPVEQIIKEKTVTLNFKSKSIVNILSEIQKQSGVNYGFEKGLDPKAMGTFDISVQNITIEKALNSLLLSSKYTYRVLDDMISIVEKTPTKSESNTTQKEEIVELAGKVVDESDAAVPGATVIVKGTATGAITDNQGRFAIKASIGSLINVSFSGMKEVDYKVVKADNKIVIKLLADALAVDDVVVTGLLPRKKSGFAGTSTVITKAELQRVSTGNIFTTIATLDAGFKIDENNLQGSNPNVLPDFTIRGKGSFQNGSTSPIFIMDGFEVTSQKVFDMDINRIESITLLKDASATILYGSRAANGVVVIETVAPKPGKLRVTYDFKPTIGVVDLTGYDLMNATEKLEYERLAGLYTREGELLDEYDRNEQNILDLAYYNRYKNVIEGVDTYWLSQPVQTSFSHAHSLYVEGGDNNIRYGIDASYNGNSGVMKQSGRDRVGLGFSLIYRIKDKVTIKNYISYAHTHAYNSPYGSFSQYTLMNPYERIRDDNGDLIPKLSDDSTNPLYDAVLPYKNYSNLEEFREQLNVEWSIVEGLRLRGQFQVQKGNGRGEVYKSPFAAEFLKSTFDWDSYSYQYLPINKRGRLTTSNSNEYNLSGNITLDYNKKVNKHIFYVGAGVEMLEDNSSSGKYSMTGFADDRYYDANFAIQFEENSRVKSEESLTRSFGAFANLNYIYDDRYFVDLSGRLDGSSRFGSDEKYAAFWSAGAGWNVHNEKFFKNTKINMFKIRYSYGVTGNQEFSAYQAKTTFTFNTDRLYNNAISASLKGYGNPDLKWQNQYQSNVGVDLGFFKDRIRAQFNYYSKRTEGMLTTITVAPSVGFAGYTANLGKIQNNGLEANLNGVLMRKPEKDFEWSVMVQMAQNKNKLLEISSALKTVNDKNNENKTIPGAVYEEGESMTAIKAVQSLGIDPVTGQELFVKKDGSLTYVWDAADKILCGDSEPKLFGNFGTNVFYKGWNLNLSFRYDFGSDYYNSTLAQRVEGANPALNADRRVLNDRWKEPGQHALYKNIKEYETTYISTRFVQKESTLKLQNVSLSYDFSREIAKKMGMNTFRLSFYMNDVFRVSTVKAERGLDYPFQMSYIFGINIGF